jgi:hypothetical protein
MQPTTPSAPPITIKGRNGTITFDGQAVTISRTGFLAAMTQGRGDKWIPINRISAVQLKPNGIKAGYVEFTIAGGNELHNRRTRAGERSQNENVVLFGRKVEPEMRSLVQAIQSAIAGQG